jgi:hypothetical protein
MTYRNVYFSGDSSSSSFWARPAIDQSKVNKKTKKNTLLSGARGRKKYCVPLEDRDRTD